MSDPPKGNAVRWSLPLVALLMAAMLTVLGLVGFAAAQPPAAQASMYFAQGRGTATILLTPSPDWGSRAIRMWIPNAPSCDNNAGYAGPFGCPYAQVSITSCLDPTCQHLGTFRWTNVSVYHFGQTLPSLTGASAFLVTLTNSPWKPTVLDVAAEWSWGLNPILGGTNLEMTFAWVSLGGVVMLLAGSIAWRLATRAPRPELHFVG